MDPKEAKFRIKNVFRSLLNQSFDTDDILDIVNEATTELLEEIND